MALPRPDNAEVFNVHPTGEQYTEFFSRALVRTQDLEVVRLVMPAGSELKEHGVEGALTLQCVEGVIELEACGKRVCLRENEMTYLQAREVHAVHAIKNAVVLLTIVLHKAEPALH